MKKIFTTKVTLDIHPDGDIYIFDGDTMCYAGQLVDEGMYDSSKIDNTVRDRNLRLFKKFKVKSPLR